MSKKIIFAESRHDVSAGLKEDAKIVIMNSGLLAHDISGSAASTDYIKADGLVEISGKAGDWQRKWSEKRFKSLGNRNFKEIATHRGISLWWFANFWLHYHTIHHETVQNAIRYIEIIDAAVRKEQPEEIMISGKRSFLNRIVIEYAKANKLLVKDIGEGIGQSIKTRLKNSAPYIIEWLKMKKFMFRSIASKIIYIGYAPNMSDKKFLVTSYVHLGKKDKDPWIDPVISEISRRGFKYVNVDIDYKTNLGIADLLARRKNHVPCEFYQNHEIRRIVREKSKELDLILKGIEGSDEFKASFSYKGVDLWNVLGRRMKFMIRKKYAEAVMFIELFDRMIKQEKPRYVYAMDEPHMFGRSCVTGAKLNNIPVFDVQFGMMIGGLSYEYTHLKGEISENGRIMSPYCPSPDLIAVYSDKFRDFLVKECNFPSKRLVVTGPPRYDPLFEKIKSLDRKEICREFGIDPDKRIVVLCTQPNEDNEIMSRAVMGIASNAKDIQVIIKMHPRDTFYRQYKRIDKELKAGSIISKDIDLIKSLFVSDVMITKYSTSAVEAAILSKPIIILNLSSRSDPGGYVKEGVALPAYSKEELEDAVKNAIYDKKTISMLDSKRQIFIKNMVHKTDGGAAARVINAVLKIKRR